MCFDSLSITIKMDSRLTAKCEKRGASEEYIDGSDLLLSCLGSQMSQAIAYSIDS